MGSTEYSTFWGTKGIQIQSNQLLKLKQNKSVHLIRRAEFQVKGQSEAGFTWLFPVNVAHDITLWLTNEPGTNNNNNIIIIILLSGELWPLCQLRPICEVTPDRIKSLSIPNHTTKPVTQRRRKMWLIFIPFFFPSDYYFTSGSSWRIFILHTIIQATQGEFAERS